MSLIAVHSTSQHTYNIVVLTMQSARDQLKFPSRTWQELQRRTSTKEHTYSCMAACSWLYIVGRRLFICCKFIDLNSNQPHRIRSIIVSEELTHPTKDRGADLLWTCIVRFGVLCIKIVMNGPIAGKLCEAGRKQK